MPHVNLSVFHRKHHTLEGMNAIYLNSTLRTLVLAIVGIFTPVYLYRLGMGRYGEVLPSILLVIVYYIIIRGTVLLLAIPVSRVIEEIGFRKSVLISVFLLSGNLISLYFTDFNFNWLFLAALLSGINIPFYWISRQSAISIDSRAEDIGKQVGMLTLLEKASYILGPVAGGLIIEYWGFHIMYGIAFLLLLFSVIPVFMMPHHVHRNGVSLKGFFVWMKDRKFFHQAIALFARASDDYGNGVVWPLFVSMLGSGLAVVGSLFSAVSVVSLITRYVSGLAFDKLHDKGGNEDEKLFGAMALLNSIYWIVRLFVTTMKQVFLVDLTIGAAGTAYRNMSDSYRYLGGKRMSEIAYYTYSEMMYSVAVLMILSIMAIGAYYGVWREVVIVTASFWVIVSMVQSRESNMHR